jgi:hypothetical protein
MAMPKDGSTVTVSHGDVTTTATMVGLIGAGGGRANVVVRLAGTDQTITVPMTWIVERT